MEASSKHLCFIPKTFQNLGVFKIFQKHVPKPLVFARFLPRMMHSSKNLKNPWFLIHVHPKPWKTLGKNSFFSMEAASRHLCFILKTFQNLGVFKIFQKNVPKPMVFARFLPRMMDSSKSLKNPWFLIHFHPKPLNTLGKNRFFQWKLRPSICASSQKPSKT